MNVTRPMTIRGDTAHWIMVGLMALALVLAFAGRLAGWF